MDQKIVGRLSTVYEQARQDVEYRKLLEEYRVREAQLFAGLEAMGEQQCSIVLDYLGLIGEMHRKLLEFSCKERLREGH